MPENVIGKIPDFNTDDTASPAQEGTEEVKETPGEEPEEPEKEIPSKLPVEEKPAPSGSDNTEVFKQVQGLQAEKEKLLGEIKELRGSRREIKQEEIKQVQKQMDDLKDLNPGDVEIIDRILNSRGVVSSEKANEMFYNYVVEEEKNKFLEKFPEYKPENDPNDINWNALQRELGLYRKPTDPHLIATLLQRAHQAIQKVPSDQGIAQKKRQAEVAGVGGGGAQRSSSKRYTLDPQKRQALENGGWSEEEIKKIEQNLTE